jgi:hypothetical protein
MTLPCSPSVNGNEINQNVEPLEDPSWFFLFGIFPLGNFISPRKRIFLLHKNEKIKKSFSKKFHRIRSEGNSKGTC